LVKILLATVTETTGGTGDHHTSGGLQTGPQTEEAAEADIASIKVV